MLLALERLANQLHQHGLWLAVRLGRKAGLKPSSIVLDLTMPRMDGWEFRQTQMADRELKDIPVIVATAADFSDETIQRQFGNVPFLRKPFDPETFLNVIAQLLSV